MLSFPSRTKRMARYMVRRADAERDRGNFSRAAFLYEEALRLLPTRRELHVQCGHMLKECGRSDEAEAHYKCAAEFAPNDADLALQLGHFYKSRGRLALAHEAYSRAADLKPGWAEPLT